MAQYKQSYPILKINEPDVNIFKLKAWYVLIMVDKSDKVVFCESSKYIGTEKENCNFVTCM